MSPHFLRYLSCGLALLAAGCAVAPRPDAPTAPIADVPGAWHAGAAGADPIGWTHWKVRRDKKETRYTVVIDAVVQADGGLREQAVLKAQADGSASGLRREWKADLSQTPVLRWQWKVVDLIAEADNTRRDLEDAPVRLILAFDGDRSKLPFSERLLADQVRLLTGNELPYATLMYIWENRQPEGSIIANAYSARVKMVVAQSGRDAVGQWQTRERDVVADFERAFGEKPGRLLGISVLTDTDNTGAQVEAYYGDLGFEAHPVASAR